MEKNYAAGLTAGIGAGIISGLILMTVNMMPIVAGIAGSDSAAAGWLVYLIIAALIGLAFTWWFGGQAVAITSGIGYGLLHGFIWWIVSGLFLIPLLAAAPLFEIFTQAGLVNLISYLVYGILIGAGYTALTRGVSERRTAFAKRDDIDIGDRHDY